MGIAAALAAGTALQVGSSIMGGEAARSSAKFNIKALQQQRQQEQAASRAQGRRNESSNIVQVAKSGVRLAGSPMEVLAANARQEDLQRAFSFSRDQNQIELLRLRRGQARVGAGFSAGGQALVGGASVGREIYGTAT